MKNKLSSSEIRAKFLEYFANHNHRIVASSSLVPVGDPSLFFTNAGMVQFKELFLGREQRSYTRAVTAQRCLRASGKHNDLENVGYTTRHHTFFEMLGNFSFGDYFKVEAIHYAWQFLTQELAINPDRLWITVHQQDRETEELWQQEFASSGKHPQGLSYCGDQDNFWAMGDQGPCGYCSEIFYDHGDHLAGDPPGGKVDGQRYVEIWNLVFMQFERDAAGQLSPLPSPSIDTGMGLERIAAAMQGVHDNYEIDTFATLRQAFIQLFQDKFPTQTASLNTPAAQITARVVVDHIRSVAMLIADGVIPSNEKSGYVLRSIIRRAVYYLYRIGIRSPFFYLMVAPLAKLFANEYPELKLMELQPQISCLIQQEEARFLETLDHGMKIFEQEIATLTDNTIPGTTAFYLHDTYGLPIALTTEIAAQRGLKLDQSGFNHAMEQQREASRAATKFCTGLEQAIDSQITTEFVGYTSPTCATTICEIRTANGDTISELVTHTEGILILAQTPFYGESGGQIGDRGTISTNEAIFVVHDTQKIGKTYLHYGTLQRGTLHPHDEVTAQIDSVGRQSIRANHSATHLLHRCLRSILGDHATQRGSRVDDGHLRFDFTHTQALTDQELREIELAVNHQIRANLPVTTNLMTLEEAKQTGACALFGEKYGEDVRVVTMGTFSKELCGGTHVQYTGEIGLFKITAELSIAAGVRRIEAVTGEAALLLIQHNETQLKTAAHLLTITPEQLITKIEQLLAEQKHQEQELTRFQEEQRAQQNRDLVKKVTSIAGTSVLITQIATQDSKYLRQTMDNLKNQLSSAVIVLGSVKNFKVHLLIGVTNDLLKRVEATALLHHLTEQIGGSGGGKRELAQGGGTADPATFSALLDSALLWLEKKLKN